MVYHPSMIYASDSFSAPLIPSTPVLTKLCPLRFASAPWMCQVFLHSTLAPGVVFSSFFLSSILIIQFSFQMSPLQRDLSWALFPKDLNPSSLQSIHLLVLWCLYHLCISQIVIFIYLLPLFFSNWMQVPGEYEYCLDFYCWISSA